MNAQPEHWLADDSCEAIHSADVMENEIDSGWANAGAGLVDDDASNFAISRENICMFPIEHHSDHLHLKQHSRELVRKAQGLLQQSVMLSARLRAITMAAYHLKRRVSSACGQ
jgi:hypothetical protein